MGKTNHIIIGKDRKPKSNLILKNQIIEKKDQYKHLGIIHSSDGQMTKHITMIDNKVKVITSKIMQLPYCIPLKKGALSTNKQFTL